jgi:hypothetical protein
MEYPYKTLADLHVAMRKGLLPEGEFCIIIDNDSVIAMVHPGWDEDGEELGDPQYLWKSDDPREALEEALHNLGMPAEQA